MPLLGQASSAPTSIMSFAGGSLTPAVFLVTEVNSTRAQALRARHQCRCRVAPCSRLASQTCQARSFHSGAETMAGDMPARDMVIMHSCSEGMQGDASESHSLQLHAWSRYKAFAVKHGKSTLHTVPTKIVPGSLALRWQSGCCDMY